MVGSETFGAGSCRATGSAGASGPLGDHWQRHALQWDSVGPPLRPGSEDVAIAERMVDRARCHEGSESMRNALLGVTPELVGMNWPTGSRLLSVDRSRRMIREILPRRAAVPVTPICASWLDMPLVNDCLDCVIGDGCFTVLENVEMHRRLWHELHRVLRPGRFLVIRLFVQPPERESVSAVFDDLAAGLIGSFHVFKWRLAMALHDNLDEGVCVSDIWGHWASAGVNAESLATRLNWPIREVRTIEVYRGSPARYTFPTLEQARKVLAECFDELACHVPEYELGDRCPTLLLAARD